MESRLLEGQVALVTGGSRGIGAAVCRRLAANGATVALVYRERSDAAERVSRSIQELGGRCLPLRADLENAQATSEMLAHARGELGPVETFVHCAWPGWKGGAADEVDWSDFERYFAAMVGTCHRLVREILPEMRRRRSGSVVLLGTTSLYELNPGHAAYVTAKGGLLALTRSLARDAGPDGVRVNMVSPGLLWTGVGPAPADWGVEHVRRAAMRRLPTADEVAGTVVFLASPWASAVTGAQISPSGGLVMQLG